MLKVVIVDDIKSIRETIKTIVEEQCKDIVIVAEASNVNDGTIAILEHKPDLVFLDIEMPDGTGFDLLQNLMPVDFKTIFITGHEGFAIKAFKFSAIDYILKPVNPRELLAAIEKAKEAIDKNNLNLKLNSLFSNLNNNNPKKIILKTADFIYSVNIEDIIRCESDKNYTTFFLNTNKKIVISTTLKDYEDTFVASGFFRAHKSHLINIKYFDKISKKDGDSIVMKDNSEIPLSSRKKIEFISYLESQ